MPSLSFHIMIDHELYNTHYCISKQILHNPRQLIILCPVRRHMRPTRIPAVPIPIPIPILQPPAHAIKPIQIKRATRRFKQGRQIQRHAMRRIKRLLSRAPSGAIIQGHFIDGMAGQTGHSDRRARVLVCLQLFRGHEAQTRADFLEGTHGAPQAFGHMAFAAEAAHEVERHVEFVAALGGEFGGGVSDGEKQHGEGADEEVVEHCLLGAVDVRGAVDVCEDADRVLCDFDDGVGEVEV